MPHCSEQYGQCVCVATPISLSINDQNYRAVVPPLQSRPILRGGGTGPVLVVLRGSEPPAEFLRASPGRPLRSGGAVTSARVRTVVRTRARGSHKLTATRAGPEGLSFRGAESLSFYGRSILAVHGWCGATRRPETEI